jgi:hypothetical protein
MLRVIWAVSVGASLLIFAQLFLIGRREVFGSESIYLLINSIVIACITIAIVREVIRNSKWRNSWRVSIIGAVGVAGTLMLLLLNFGAISVLSAPQLALAITLTGGACGLIWLLGIFLFLIIRIKIAQEAFKARLN